MEFKANKNIDCSGQLCPVPILMTEECFATLAPGEVLEVVFTDPGAEPDLRAWCRANRQTLLGFTREGTSRRAYLRKDNSKGR